MKTYRIDYQPKVARYYCVFEMFINAENYVDAMQQFQNWDSDSDYNIIRIIVVDE